MNEPPLVSGMLKKPFELKGAYIKIDIGSINIKTAQEKVEAIKNKLKNIIIGYADYQGTYLLIRVECEKGEMEKIEKFINELKKIFKEVKSNRGVYV